MSVRVRACDDHVSSKPGECVKCETWPAKYPALLCDDCGPKPGGRACYICGHVPAGDPVMVCYRHNGICLKCYGYVWQPTRNTRSSDSDLVAESWQPSYVLHLTSYV